MNWIERLQQVPEFRAARLLGCTSIVTAKRLLANQLDIIFPFLQ